MSISTAQYFLKNEVIIIISYKLKNLNHKSLFSSDIIYFDVSSQCYFLHIDKFILLLTHFLLLYYLFYLTLIITLKEYLIE